MDINPILRLATVVSKDISNTLDVSVRRNELENSIADFKKYMQSVLGDDFEDIKIQEHCLIGDISEIEAQLQSSMSQLKEAFIMARTESAELCALPDTIFRAPKIKIRCTIPANNKTDGSFAKGLPCIVLPQPLDEELDNLHKKAIEAQLQAMELMEQYMHLYNKKKESLKIRDYPCTTDDELMHLSNIYSKDQLIKLFGILKEQGYISCDTDMNDFIYYMSGVGGKPTHILKWEKTSTSLAFFINTLYFNEPKKWIKTKNVFNKSNLSKLLSKASYSKSEDKFRDEFKKIKEMIS